MNETLIENIISYTFKDKKLLNRCFTHSSYANEHNQISNETLEFLGDSVLNIVVTEKLVYLYKDKSNEGELSKVRARIVSTESLFDLCERLGLQKYLKYILSTNAKMQGKKIYADLIESIIGGIYIDGGINNAKDFILRELGDKFAKETPEAVKCEDYKTALQELVQKYKLGEIEYSLIERSGLDHLPSFEYCVKVNGETLGKGNGSSKKEAQRYAAKQSLDILKDRGIRN